MAVSKRFTKEFTKGSYDEKVALLIMIGVRKDNVPFLVRGNKSTTDLMKNRFNDDQLEAIEAYNEVGDNGEYLYTQEQVADKYAL